MSFEIDHMHLSETEQRLIQNNLILEKPVNKFCGYPQKVSCFQIAGTKGHPKLSIPFAFTKTYLGHYIETKQFTKNKLLKFEGTLNEVQNDIKKELFNILNTTQCAIISLACGMGKTALAIYICSKLQYKTLVICHRIILLKQWHASINKFCPNAKIQTLTSSNDIDLSCDFFLINLTNVPKRQKQDFIDIGIVVCDEAHVVATDKLVQGLFNTSPKYCIGLTATPKRPDGMDKVLELVFGKNIISRKNTKEFNVYCYKTGIDFETKETNSGSLDWNSIVESQSNHEQRNLLICRLAKFMDKDNIIIACKRVEQCTILFEILKQQGEHVCVFKGTDKTFDETARIFITTLSKGSVGLDHPKLNLLILASDCKEGLEQLVGRIFRRPDVESKVIDLVDNFGVLQSHWKLRKDLYVSLGAKISQFTRSFTQFETSE